MSFGSDSGGTFVKGTTYRFNISAGVEKTGIFFGQKGSEMKGGDE